MFCFDGCRFDFSLNFLNYITLKSDSVLIHTAYSKVVPFAVCPADKSNIYSLDTLLGLHYLRLTEKDTREVLQLVLERSTV
jgi:hypothetical protein